MSKKIKKKAVKKKVATKKVSVMSKGEIVREVELPISDNRELQDGVNPRGKLGKNHLAGTAVVGSALGVTINMGDFQSARIDVFIQRTVEDDEEVIQQTFEEIQETLQEEIERQSSYLDN